jgi:glycosyltransferase involved in cell wall biosynthesis
MSVGGRDPGNMISFLFVDNERVWRGGQDQLFSLLLGMLLRGHSVHLVCHPGTLLEERARKAGVSVHPLSLHAELDPVFYLRFRSLVRGIGPDILAFNTPRAIVPANMASRGSSVRARLVFRRVNFPLRRNAWTRWKYANGIDSIVAISESIRSQLLTAGIPPGKIRTIYEGIDVKEHPRRVRRELPPGTPAVVGTVSHLSLEKGHAHLVEAAARIPEVRSRIRFVVVGDGECRAQLEQQARAQGVSECFEFTGFRNNPIEMMRAFDIFVLPSLSEGLSSAILNAMAEALPVVATNVGGIPELVWHEYNGLLVPAANAFALAGAILRLAQNPSERALMGDRGRARVEERFTLEHKLVETEKLCASFLK